jgi:hypothetical protein
MNIIIDNRNSDAIYVNKANNHIANSDEIIRFILTDNNSNIDKYIAIIAGIHHLGEAEAAVLKYVMINDNTALSGEICVAVAKIINKSTATVARAIVNLRDKKLIYGNGAKAVKLSTSIATSIKALSKAKFFVIEVNPEVTSPKIEL